MKLWKRVLTGIIVSSMAISAAAYAAVPEPSVPPTSEPATEDLSAGTDADLPQADSDETQKPGRSGSQDTNNHFADVEGSGYETAVGLLSSISVMEGLGDGSFGIADDVTRAEATATIVRMIGLGELSGSSQSDETYYYDVSPGSWYATYINTATRLGLVAGDGDQNFRPEDPVLYEEYIKMLLSAVGYQEEAITKGGYPQGYLTVARQRGFTDGEAVKQGQNITRGAVALYTYNALDIPQTRDESTRTLLDEVFHLTEYNGIVTGNEYTGLYDADKKTSTNMVRIDAAGSDLLLDAGKTDAPEYLGYMVSAYVKNDKASDDEIYFIGLKHGKNTTQQLDSAEVTALSLSGNALRLEYTKDSSKAQYKNVPADAALLYNGISVGTIGSILERDYPYVFAPATGSVTLIDNNGDGTIDAAYALAYQNYVVSQVYEKEKKVLFRSNGSGVNRITSVTLDENDQSVLFQILKDGQEISLTDLKEDDVVSYRESMSGANKLMVLEVCDQVAEGTVGELYPSKNNAAAAPEDSSIAGNGTQLGYEAAEVVIDGERYPVSRDSNKVPKVGDTVSGYLNVFGQIVYIGETRAGIDSYIYLVRTSRENDMNQSINAQVVTEDGHLQVVELRDKLNFNGQTKSKEEVYPLIQGGQQLIRGTINKEGQLTRIETASTPANGRYDEEAFTLDESNNVQKGAAYKDLYYRSGTPGRINSLFAVPEGCVVFSIPEADEDTNTIDEKEIRVSHDMSTFTNDFYYVFEIYDLDKNMRAGAIVSYGLDKEKSKEGALSMDTPIFLLDYIAESVNEEGDKVYIAAGLRDNKETTVVINEELIYRVYGETALEGNYAVNAFKRLPRGSILQYKTNFDGEMNEARLLYDASTPPETTLWDSSQDVRTAELQARTYMVDALDDNIMVLSTVNGSGSASTSTMRTMTISKEQTVYVFDQYKDEVRLGTVGDIIPGYGTSNGSLVMVRFFKDNLREVVVLDLEALH